MVGMLTPDEVAKYLRRQRRWVYGKLKSGEIKSIRMGRSYLIPAESLAEYLHGLGMPTGFDIGEPHGTIHLLMQSLEGRKGVNDESLST